MSLRGTHRPRKNARSSSPGKAESPVARFLPSELVFAPLSSLRSNSGSRSRDEETQRSFALFDLACNAIPIGQLISHFGGTAVLRRVSRFAPGEARRDAAGRGEGRRGEARDWKGEFTYSFLARVSRPRDVWTYVGAGRYVSPRSTTRRVQLSRSSRNPRHTRIRVHKRRCRRTRCCSPLFHL